MGRRAERRRCEARRCEGRRSVTAGPHAPIHSPIPRLTEKLDGAVDAGRGLGGIDRGRAGAALAVGRRVAPVERAGDRRLLTVVLQVEVQDDILAALGGQREGRRVRGELGRHAIEREIRRRGDRHGDGHSRVVADPQRLQVALGPLRSTGVTGQLARRARLGDGDDRRSSDFRSCRRDSDGRDGPSHTLGHCATRDAWVGIRSHSGPHIVSRRCEASRPEVCPAKVRSRLLTRQSTWPDPVGVSCHPTDLPARPVVPFCDPPRVLQAPTVAHTRA
ncbi:hypothetical protein SDC9_160058 [bioreactor metagenome]|uniref:Uncharacterized protein n=1 Tax=bioreactor metagenome TaxID=1076179 RepID=A0A645FEB7_9ZZZZ